MRNRSVAVLGLAALLSLSLACNRVERERDEAAAGGSSVAKEAPAMLTVKDIDLGRTLNPDKGVADHTGDFKPTETVYASVETDGVGKGTLKARWTFANGQVVDESTQEITTSGPARTEFHIAKPSGLPVGKYHVEVTLNGAVAGSKDFEVKK